jgi:CRP-like cAMP-binding protein
MNQEITDVVNDFFSQFRIQKFSKGEILIHGGDTPNGVYFLKNGLVKEYAISKNGDELVVNVFRESAFFPMTCVLNDSLNEYYFEAMTKVDVVCAPREEILNFLDKNPLVVRDLLSRVLRGMDGVLSRTTYLMSGNARNRLVMELVLYAKRFGKSLTPIMVELSEKELAAQAGLTRETVSREMRKLKQEGLVRVVGKINLIDSVEKLETELLNS